MNQARLGASQITATMRNTVALVLAGGRGSRLMHLTNDIAKPAVPFAGKYRIVDFPLSNCINSGIRRIAVLTQYKAQALIQHVQRGWGFLKAELQEFIEVWPAQQQTPDEHWYQGTADAVYQNIAALREMEPTHVLILGGDHVYKQDYGIMLAEHIERDAEVTVACVEVPVKEATGFGVVGVDANDAIESFLEKPAEPPALPDQPDRAFASMGIYVFNADVLYEILRQDADSATSSRDFGKDILPSLIGKCRLYAHRFSKSCIYNDTFNEVYWRDVGTVDAYWAANLDLTRVTPALNLYDPTWPIWTHQEQYPAAKFVFEGTDRQGVAYDSLVSAGCIVSGGVVRRSLLFNNVFVHSFSLVEDSVILPNVHIMRHCRLKRAIVGRNCILPHGLVVGENPELDAKRFHRTEGGITLITESMLADL